jgi:NAD(P)-dependent dehydrogenase (short-subunit alcohol dehydrogenase family)
MAIILVTGAATGIGNLTAVALARAGHHVYASMRAPAQQDREHVEALEALARTDALSLKVIALDVLSSEQAEQAAEAIIQEQGAIDVVVHNAGHLQMGYAEAFTPEEFAHLFDINVLGMQRVNRAVLPHMRKREAGYLITISSTTIVTSGPFMATYAATKAAADALAQSTAYEVSQFGIGSTLITVGGIRSGTNHFVDATKPADADLLAQYARLDEIRAPAAAAPTKPDQAPPKGPEVVAEEVVNLVALAPSERPFRTVVAPPRPSVVGAIEAMEAVQREVLGALNIGHLFPGKAA